MNSTWTAAVAAATGCSGPRAMRGHCGKAPQLNSKQISANYLTLIMNLEPAMRVSRARQRESRRQREREICKIDAASCGERVSPPALFTLCLSPGKIKRCWCYRIAWEVLHFHFYERFFLHFPRLICIFMHMNLSSTLPVREMPHKSLTLLASSSSPNSDSVFTKRYLHLDAAHARCNGR